MSWLARILDLPDDQPPPTAPQLRQPDYSSPAPRCELCGIQGHTVGVCQMAPCWRLASSVAEDGCECGFPKSVHQGGDS